MKIEESRPRLVGVHPGGQIVQDPEGLSGDRQKLAGIQPADDDLFVLELAGERENRDPLAQKATPVV
jgi:hypothetical protein